MDAVDRLIADLAEIRGGLLARPQLLDAGLSRKQIGRRVASGRLRVVHRSVYALVSGPLSDEQLGIAACLAVPDGVLAHLTAGAFHRLRGVPSRRLEMLVPPGRHPALEGVHFRRTNRLPEHHVLVLPNGMRVTTVARTIYDLGGILDAAAHRNVLTDAINRGVVTLAEVVAVGREMAGRGRPGSRAHHRLAVTAPESVEGVMSEGELVLGDALRRAGIPVVRQHAVRLSSGRQARLDLALPECRLDIEVDHPTWHATPEALQSDHTRDNELTLLEWEHVRFTSDDVGARLASCVAIVRTLARRRGAGGP